MDHNTELKMKNTFDYFRLMARTISSRVSKLLSDAIVGFDRDLVAPAEKQAEDNIEADDKAASRLRTVLSQQWNSAFKEAWKYVDDASEGLVGVHEFDQEALGSMARFDGGYDRMIWKS